jgi:hypothetical protein
MGDDKAKESGAAYLLLFVQLTIHMSENKAKLNWPFFLPPRREGESERFWKS